MTISSLPSMQHEIRSAISMERGKRTDGRDDRIGFHPSFRTEVKNASGISMYPSSLRRRCTMYPSSLRRRCRQCRTESGRGYPDGEEESGR